MDPELGLTSVRSSVSGAWACDPQKLDPSEIRPICAVAGSRGSARSAVSRPAGDCDVDCDV